MRGFVVMVGTERPRRTRSRNQPRPRGSLPRRVERSRPAVVRFSRCDLRPPSGQRRHRLVPEHLGTSVQLSGGRGRAQGFGGEAGAVLASPSGFLRRWPPRDGPIYHLHESHSPQVEGRNGRPAPSVAPVQLERHLRRRRTTAPTSAAPKARTGSRLRRATTRSAQPRLIQTTERSVHAAAAHRLHDLLDPSSTSQQGTPRPDGLLCGWRTSPHCRRERDPRSSR